MDKSEQHMVSIVETLQSFVGAQPWIKDLYDDLEILRNLVKEETQQANG